MQKATTLFMALTIMLSLTSSCEPGNDPFINTPEEEAARIRANTPTELPPITTTGENTMGAYIIPQPGSELHRLAGQDTILFVASGVERIDPVGASSTDCNAFQNFRYESRMLINIKGYWCPRPEIGDTHSQTLSFTMYKDGNARLTYSYDKDGDSLNRSKYTTDTIDSQHFLLMRHDLTSRVISLTFDSIALEGWQGTLGRIDLRGLRLDARYGSTP